MVDTPSPRCLGRFELLWAHAAQVTAAAHAIVEVIDVVGRIIQRQFSVLVDLLLEPALSSSCRRRTRRHHCPSSCPSSSCSAPGGWSGNSAARHRCRTAYLNPNESTCHGGVAKHSHQHRVEHELAVNGGSCRPADDLARAQIHDDGQVEPALPRPNVGHIRDPRLVSTRHRELPLQESGNQDGGLANRPAPCAIAVQGAQLTLAHQARDAVLTAGLAGLPQVRKTRGAP